jgi:rSAM/selenodomain-associated transferase 1
MNENACILFYVKFPEEGKIKTRLARDIGDAHAVKLYRCFILDMLDSFAHIPQQVCICYAPEESEHRFKEWLGETYLYMPQYGHDLGERMCRSFQEAFEQGFQHVCIIGSDLPDLPCQYVAEAFERLHSFDSVIGPSHDGGYYLLGFQRETFFPEIFQDISWSQSSVYAETVKKFEQREATFFTLSTWNDIDKLRELQQWYTQNRIENTRASRTIGYLQQMGGLGGKCLK